MMFGSTGRSLLAVTIPVLMAFAALRAPDHSVDPRLPSTNCFTNCECPAGFYHEEPDGGTWLFFPVGRRDGTCNSPEPPCSEVDGCVQNWSITYDNPAFAGFIIKVILPGGGGSVSFSLDDAGHAHFNIDRDYMACGDAVLIQVIDPFTMTISGDFGKIICGKCELG